MNNFIIWIILICVSVFLGFIKYRGNTRYIYETDSGDKKNPPFSWKFTEIWNQFFNFFLGGVISYYFIDIKYKVIISNGVLNFGDFILLFVGAMCFLGYFPHLLKNLTQGINAILQKIMDKNS